MTTEAAFVDNFKAVISKTENLFDITALGTEFDYRNGRIDVIAKTKDGYLVAFEAKIERWRVALDQAYRNTSFTHYSYVLIPKVSSKRATAQFHEFELRGVGLCTMDDDGVTIEIEASKKEPTQPWLTEDALRHISKV